MNPETGIRSDIDIDDALGETCERIKEGEYSGSYIDFHLESEVLKKDIFVPKYYDESANDELKRLVRDNPNLEIMTVGELVESSVLEVTKGHGSPSSDQRVGEIPYIKVSDLRAGSVNINPTNMIPAALAKQFWRGESSGLMPYDLISPERASKNIGEFCVLMPGQENVVLTKEVIVMRTASNASFDQFYLMWALSLSAVRKQWERIVFMQTNREDVGKRMFEVLLPYPKSKEFAEEVSKPFKIYYESLERARLNFITQIKDSTYAHHIHLGEIRG